MKIEGGITIDSIHVQPSPETSKLKPIAHLPPDPIKPIPEVISYDTINKNISVDQILSILQNYLSALTSLFFVPRKPQNNQQNGIQI